MFLVFKRRAAGPKVIWTRYKILLCQFTTMYTHSVSEGTKPDCKATKSQVQCKLLCTCSYPAPCMVYVYGVYVCMCVSGMCLYLCVWVYASMFVYVLVCVCVCVCMHVYKYMNTCVHAYTLYNVMCVVFTNLICRDPESNKNLTALFFCK